MTTPEVRNGNLLMPSAGEPSEETESRAGRCAGGGWWSGSKEGKTGRVGCVKEPGCDGVYLICQFSELRKKKF